MVEFLDITSLTDLRNLALATIVGFLTGFEREWTRVAEAREHSFAGARTFSLIGFVGGLSGLLSDNYALAIITFAAVAALTVAAYWSGARDKQSYGGTTELAILAVFLLGLAATRGHILLASVGGVSVAIILSLKETIEKIAASLNEVEIRAALRFLAISIIVLPILPNQGYGPYEALNPREIWLMVVFISGLSFLGYWLTKILGANRGVLLTGLVGGLASSTATTLSLAKFARDGSAGAQSVASGVIAANVVMLVRVGLLLAAVAQSVLAAVWPALLIAALVGAVAAAVLWRSARRQQSVSDPVAVGNPMEIKPALIFAFLLAAIALASRFGADQFGESALYVIGIISGLADVDALSLAAGRQAATGAISAVGAGGAVLLAITSNIVVKATMAGMIGGRALGAIVGIAFAAAVVAGGLAYAVLLQ